MKTYLFIWFDVEDYVTAESDVALGRLVEILDRHEVKATFKLVGEKLRGLQRRGHTDIVKQLAQHAAMSVARATDVINSIEVS